MKAKDIFAYILGGIIVIGFFVMIYVMLSKEVPATNKEYLGLLIGALITNFGMVVGYYYGSSKSSSEHSDTINKMIDNLSPPAGESIATVVDKFAKPTE